jgi:hypothetical protein
MKPLLYMPIEEGEIDYSIPRRKKPMGPYKGKTHYFTGIDPAAEEILRKVIEFFEKNGLNYYQLQGPQIREENTGQGRYIEVTVSIKLS